MKIISLILFLVLTVFVIIYGVPPDAKDSFFVRLFLVELRAVTSLLVGSLFLFAVLFSLNGLLELKNLKASKGQVTLADGVIKLLFGLVLLGFSYGVFNLVQSFDAIK